MWDLFLFSGREFQQRSPLQAVRTAPGAPCTVHRPGWVSLSGAEQPGSLVPPMEWVGEDVPIVPSFPFPHIWRMIIRRMSSNRHFFATVFFFCKASELIGDIWPFCFSNIQKLFLSLDALMRGTGLFWKTISHLFFLATFFLQFLVSFHFIRKCLLWCLEVSFSFSSWN